ncbi:hypothetical protein JW992_07750 [candidate division KSB1 bacterium]|nr:hypothetical protein [candidate division KSB1 bacterium]
MGKGIVFVVLLLTSALAGSDFPLLLIPVRPPKAQSAEQVLALLEKLPPDERENEITTQLSGGNMPDFLRRPVEICVQSRDAQGVLRRIRFAALADYLAVGTDSAFCRLPMRPQTAQCLAERWNLLLPTPKIVDWIDDAAQVRIEPVTYFPIGNRNEQIERFIAHQRDIEARRQAPPGLLTSGLKKDIVLCSRIDSSKSPDRVAIYGWQRLDGTAIQPLYCGHSYRYVDYSHGARLIHSTVYIDDEAHDLRAVLSDSLLFRLFSDEPAPLHRASYPLE